MVVAIWECFFGEGGESSTRSACAPQAVKIRVIRGWSQNKMPDVDSYDSSSGIAVDVQQRLNCALP